MLKFVCDNFEEGDLFVLSVEDGEDGDVDRVRDVVRRRDWVCFWDGGVRGDRNGIGIGGGGVEG